LTFASPGLVLEAEEVRKPAGAGIDVDGRGEDVVTLPEDRLRAVPVMRVDVDDGDRLCARSRRYCAATAALFR
jgi:hypothetical protein